MANEWTDTARELGRRARQLLVDLGLVPEQPERVPVPVRSPSGSRPLPPRRR